MLLITKSFISQLLFLVSCLAVEVEKPVKNYFQNNNDLYETYNQIPRISKSYQVEESFRLIPHGSELIIMPQLKIPIKNLGVIKSALDLSFPITISLDALTMNKAMDWDRFGGEQGEWVWTTIKDRLNKARKKRSVSTYLSPSQNSTHLQNISHCKKLSFQKLALFKKLESLLNTVMGYMSWKQNAGEACLLRTICEIQEFPVTQEFGLFGDLLRELVRVDQFTSKDKCAEVDYRVMKSYVKAQQNGAKGSCSKYYKMCDKSIFA